MTRNARIGCQHVDQQRHLVLCENLASVSPSSSLIRCCPVDQRYYLLCCRCHNNARSTETRATLCHHFPLALASAYVTSNGCSDAAAGIGGALGVDQSWSLPVDNVMDPGQARRNNQRAELLAVIAALRRLRKTESKVDTSSGDANHAKNAREWVIGTDSAYVIEGCIQLYPKWRAHRWRTSTGKAPANLDLFHKLNQLIESTERSMGISIGFWSIKGAFPAQELARSAAAAHRPGPSCSPLCRHDARAPCSERFLVVDAATLRPIAANVAAAPEGKGKAKQL